MKKILLLFSPLFLLFFISCQKEKKVTSETEMAIKTKSWLQSIIARNEKPEIKNMIEQILTGIQTDGMADARVNDQEYLTVFSLSGDYKSTLKENKPHKTFLLILSDNNRKLISAKLGRFIPDKSSPDIPASSFIDFYNKQSPGYDGKYSFLSLTGRYLYDFTFEEGNRTQSGLVKGELPNNNGLRVETQTCTFWYLEITYFYSDGTRTTTRQYLGSYCYDDCIPESACPKVLDGGGGGGTNTGTSFTVPKQYTIVSGINNSWFVVSYEKIEGVRDPSKPFGGYLTTITHQTSNYYGVATYTWREVTNTTSITNGGLIANSETNGELTDVNYGTKIPGSGFKVWTFTQVAP
ncbi:MAG: hypothetical protein K2X48_08885 [Chitinophagaceae bacterium]|nr:hypothetical protein [Chitinophagaceae bacterium]